MVQSDDLDMPSSSVPLMYSHQELCASDMQVFKAVEICNVITVELEREQRLHKFTQC